MLPRGRRSRLSRVIWTVPRPSHSRRMAVWSPRLRSTKSIRLWDSATGAPLQTLEGHSDGVRSFAFSPDGEMLASASYVKTVRLWDANTGAARQTLELDVSGLSFSSSGKCLRTDNVVFNRCPSSTSLNSLDSSPSISVVIEWIMEDEKCIL